MSCNLRPHIRAPAQCVIPFYLMLAMLQLKPCLGFKVSISPSTALSVLASTSSVPNTFVGSETSISRSGNFSASGIPTSIPHTITSPGPDGLLSDYPNYALAQIGFSMALNWSVVASNDSLRYQIYEILPWGMSFGLNMEHNEIHFIEVQANDTSRNPSSAATIAILAIPESELSNLAVSIANGSSLLYRNLNQTRQALMSLIDRSLPVNYTATPTAYVVNITNTPVATEPSPTVAPPALSDDGNLSHKVMTAAVVGSVVGLLGLLGITAGIILYIKRRRSVHDTVRSSTSESPGFVKSELDGSAFQKPSEVDAEISLATEMDGIPLSEAPTQPPGPGFLAEVAAGGAHQGLISELPGTNDRTSGSTTSQTI